MASPVWSLRACLLGYAAVSVGCTAPTTPADPGPPDAEADAASEATVGLDTRPRLSGPPAVPPGPTEEPEAARSGRRAPRREGPYTGPGSALPAEALVDLARCEDEVRRGASSCTLSDRREPAVLMLGRRYAGWFAQIRTRAGRHHLRLVSPGNRRAFFLGTLPVVRGCAAPYHSDSSSGLRFDDRGLLRPDAGLLVSARVGAPPGTLRLVVAESFPICDPSECDCACQGSTFVHVREVELRIPRAARRVRATGA